MENRVLKTELIAWQELNDLQPKGLKIDTNTAALKTSLQKHGFSLPFYGWRDAKGKIWIIDGHTRKTVLKELISEGVEVPELLPCTFIDAKDKKEAVKLLLEVYNQRQNQIDQFVMQVFVEEYDIPIEEVAVESLNVKEYETEEEYDDGTNNKEQPTAEEDDFDTTPPKQAVTVLGDLYEIGTHRLLCGDSTCTDSVARLMNGDKADIAFTSPPYNIMAGFNGGNIDKIRGISYLDGDGAYDDFEDKETSVSYKIFLTDILNNSLLFSDDSLINIGWVKGAIKGTALFLGENADRFGGTIIWNKNNAYMPFFPSQHGVLGNKAEPIYIFNNKGFRKIAHPQWSQGEVCYNTIETLNASSNKIKEHQATFPIELPFYVLQKFSENSVLDLFLGSGTTMLAAHQLNRKCYGMELSPLYCDVIVKRMLTYDKTLTIKRNGIDVTDDFLEMIK